MKIHKFLIILAMVNTYGNQRKISIKYGVSPLSNTTEENQRYFGLKHFGSIQYNFKNLWSAGFEFDRGYFKTNSTDTRDVKFESNRFIIYGIKETPLFYNLSFLAIGGMGIGYFNGSKDEFRSHPLIDPIIVYPIEKIHRESGFVTSQIGFKLFFHKINFGIEIVPFDLSYGNLNYSEFASKIYFSLNLF